MEQVFFRLHVRFVTTVTRLLSPKTRRVLEYVTLGNAFCLLLSLAWLHTRFVNPKERGSVVSCLPAALERAGVDPAQLHVLQIHLRRPPDDRGGDGGGSEEQIKTKPSCSTSIPSPGGGADSGDQGRDACAVDGGGDVTQSPFPSGHGDVHTAVENNGDMLGASGSSHGVGSTVPVCGEAVGDGGSGSSGGSGDGLYSESFPQEVFYSMKRVTGKDAVGTLSGPGTLGIGRLVNGEEERGAGGSEIESESESYNGAGVCGARDEEKRSAIKVLVDAALSWGKGDPGRGACGRDSRSTSAAGGVGGNNHERDGDDDGEFQRKWRPSRGRVQGDIGAQAPWCSGAIAEVASNLQEGLSQQPCEFHGEEKDREGREEAGELVQDEVYLFSLEKGFLMLRPDLRRKHGIVTANVTVNSHDPCIGGTVIQTLVRDFVGYDTVVMNWLISLYGGRGFLYGVHNNELFNLNYAAEFIESTEDLGKFLVFKVGVMFTTLFLFFTTTTLVSFTLRETQERMLKFTFLLQHHVRHRLPYAPLIFTHVVESLVFVPIMVGILFFLFEFFSDQLLAFMVLSVVWLCEVYSVVSVRTSMSIRFFPQVFFMYFTLFHVYFFSFPFGFSYLALVTTVLFLQHSMLFFWNTYEVPALRAGAVSSTHPRQAGMVIGVVPRYDPHGMGLPMVPPRPPLEQGRPRAATVDGEPSHSRGSIPAAQVAARRLIPRRNSSPDPSSPSLGGGSGGGGGDGNNRPLVRDAVVHPTSPVMDTSAPRGNELRQSSGAVSTFERNPPPPLPGIELLAREWESGETASGGGEGGGRDGGGHSDSFGDYNRGNISAPLLGAFPFSIWNLIQFSSSPTTSGGHISAGGGLRPTIDTSWQHREVGIGPTAPPSGGGFGVTGSETGVRTEGRECTAGLVALTESGRGIERMCPTSPTAESALGVHPEVDAPPAAVARSVATIHSRSCKVGISGVEREQERTARWRPDSVVVGEREGGSGGGGDGDSGNNAAERLGSGGAASADEAPPPQSLVGDEVGREEPSQETEILRRERLSLGGTQYRGMYDDG